MTMKQVYIKPNVTVVETYTERLLGTESGGQIGSPENPSDAKGHNYFFDSWDSNDEEEQPGFTSKNLWDD